MSSALYTNGHCMALRLFGQAQNRSRRKNERPGAWNPRIVFANLPMNTGVSWNWKRTTLRTFTQYTPHHVTCRTTVHVCYRNLPAEIAFPTNPSCFSVNSHFSSRALIFSTIPPHIHTVLTSNGQTLHNNPVWPHSCFKRIFCFVACILILFCLS